MNWETMDLSLAECCKTVWSGCWHLLLLFFHLSVLVFVFHFSVHMIGILIVLRVAMEILLIFHFYLMNSVPSSLVSSSESGLLFRIVCDYNDECPS